MDNLEQLPEKEAGFKPKGTHGGARPNSGPKPYGEKYKRQIAKTAEIMGKSLPEAAQATVDLATGAYVLLAYNPATKQWEKPRNQEVAEQVAGTPLGRVYRELPSTRAIEIMFERLMGKVPQPVDIRVHQAINSVIDTQSRIMRIIEEHVSDETLALIRDDLGRVAELHQDARTAVGLDA